MQVQVLKVGAGEDAMPSWPFGPGSSDRRQSLGLGSLAQVLGLGCSFGQPWSSFPALFGKNVSTAMYHLLRNILQCARQPLTDVIFSLADYRRVLMHQAVVA